MLSSLRRSIRRAPIAGAAALAFTLPAAPAFAGFAGFGLATITQFTVSASGGIRTIAVGDLDGDGDVDVLANSPGGGGDVIVLINDGSGALSVGVQIVVGANDIELGDLDGDGDLDIAMSGGSFGFRFALNNGNATFGAVQSAGGLSTGSTLMELLDVDGDGDLDAVIQSATSLRVVRNDAGAFTTLPVFGATVSASAALAVLDADDDGAPDVLSHSSAGSTCSVFLNNSDPTLVNPFTTAGSFAFGPGSSSSELTVADFDGDGLADLAKNSGSAPTLNVAYSNGDGTFTTIAVASGASFGTPAAADLDADGDIDLGAFDSSGAPDELRINFNDGAGVFSVSQDYFIALAADYVSFWLEFADMNGDGSPDAVIGARDSSVSNDFSIAVMLNQSAAIPPGSFDLLAPADATVVSLNPITPKLAWTQASGFEVSYTLTVAEDAALTIPVHVAAAIDAPCYSIPAGVLMPGRLYHWGVSANNPIGDTPSTTPSLSFSTRIPADINGDAVVDTADLGLLISAFGSVPQ